MTDQLVKNVLEAHAYFSLSPEDKAKEEQRLLDEQNNTFPEEDMFYPHRLMWEDGIWGQRIPKDFKFELGKKYARLDGKVVTIINVKDTPGYECVQADDGEDVLVVNEIKYADNQFYSEDDRDPTKLGWRYNRRGDLGRCTGSKWDDPRNLIPFEIKV